MTDINVTTASGETIQTVDQLLKRIGELEDRAYQTGVKDTLNRVLTPLTSMAKLLNNMVANIEATLAMDNLVNKDAEEAANEDGEDRPTEPSEQA